MKTDTTMQTDERDTSVDDTELDNSFDDDATDETGVQPAGGGRPDVTGGKEAGSGGDAAGSEGEGEGGEGGEGGQGAKPDGGGEGGKPAGGEGDPLDAAIKAREQRARDERLNRLIAKEEQAPRGPDAPENIDPERLIEDVANNPLLKDVRIKVDDDDNEGTALVDYLRTEMRGPMSASAAVAMALAQQVSGQVATQQQEIIDDLRVQNLEMRLVTMGDSDLPDLLDSGKFHDWADKQSAAVQQMAYSWNPKDVHLTLARCRKDLGLQSPAEQARGDEARQGLRVARGRDSDLHGSTLRAGRADRTGGGTEQDFERQADEAWDNDDDE